MKNKNVILFNPRSASSKHRIPNSILQVAASIYGKYDITYIDGNKEDDPLGKIENLLSKETFSYFGCTVMPGPQLKQAIPISKSVKLNFPEVKVIWGGYFPANQSNAVLNSGYVDVIIKGPGDNVFPKLLDAWDKGNDLADVKSLIYKYKGKIVKTATDDIPDYDTLQKLPYNQFNKSYPVKSYLAETFLGKKTTAYHSSFGCPYACSFCAVVPVYNKVWKGKSAKLIYEDIKKLKDNYEIDSVEFHDNNFFTSRKRVIEFSKLIMNEKINWWGEGRIDTLDKYTDEELKLISKAGCKMIFLGAESGSDEVLKQMNKGGEQNAKQIKNFAVRLAKFNIIPEYSFVLGLPAESDIKVFSRINEDIKFIKEIKSLNPSTEIIIYLYSPVPAQGSELYDQITKAGFSFPENLDDWLNPLWENFDLRKNPLTPWLTPKMVNKIKNFETVLNGFSPTSSDIKLKKTKRIVLKVLSAWRYKTGFYFMPYEIKLFQKIWRYRQAEIEGF